MSQSVVDESAELEVITCSQQKLFAKMTVAIKIEKRTIELTSGKMAGLLTLANHLSARTYKADAAGRVSQTCPTLCGL